MIFNLDKSFNPFSTTTESIEFDHFTFAGGEPHIKIKTDLSDVCDIRISHRIQSFNDIGLLLLAINSIRNRSQADLHLVLPYFPGARQDRLMVVGEPLTVKVYADIINSLGMKTVMIFDPHSEVTPALIDNCIVANNHQFIGQVMDSLSQNTFLVSPDGGALKKIYKVAAHLQKYEVIECSKTRDVKTGNLSGFKVYTEDLEGRDCLIVDDICDGGGTFLGLAKELKLKNAGKLYLAVSHGIFSKGLDQLSKEFEIIFTTDAFQDIESSHHFKQLKLRDKLLI